MNPNVSRAIVKCKHYEGRTWHAYLSPAEFVALCDFGATPTYPPDLTRAIEAVAAGQGRGRWYYFWPKPVLENRLPVQKKTVREMVNNIARGRKP